MSEGPVVFAYDGSDHARAAIARASELLAPAPAVALTIWESALGFVQRHHLPGSFEIARDVVDEFDDATRTQAEQTAAEGAELARAGGFETEAVARAALEPHGRDTTAAWRAVVATADELDARAIVLGSRGRSGIRSAMLGSVSQGVLTGTARAVLVVSEPEQDG